MRRCRGSSGHLVVNGEELTRDVILLPERVVTNWGLADGHRMVLDDLQDVRDCLPEYLAVGTGPYGRIPIRPSLIAAVCQRRSTWGRQPVW